MRSIKNAGALPGKSSFIPHGQFIKFSEAFARPVKHAIEMQARQSQVRTNLFLFIIGDIEAVKHLDVPFVRHLFEDLPDQIGFFFPQQLLELIGRGMGKARGFFDFSHIFLTRGAAEVIDDKVPRHTANEAGETLGLSNVSLSNLLKADAEGLLVDVFGGRRVINFPADDYLYAAAITLD